MHPVTWKHDKLFTAITAVAERIQYNYNGGKKYFSPSNFFKFFFWKAHLTFAKHIRLMTKILIGMTKKLNFLEGTCIVAFGVNITAFPKKRKSCQQLNMVVVVWRSGAAFYIRTWMTAYDWWPHNFGSLPENPEGESLSISFWPQAVMHLGFASQH